MTMLERRSRADSKPGRSGRLWGRVRRSRQAPPPPAVGPDEETVRIARSDFRKRRHAGRWRRVRRVVPGLLAVSLVLAAAWLVLFSSLVTARHVVVTGTQTLSDARIERAAAVSLGTPLARVNLRGIRARVESIAAVRRAVVSRSWPHDVNIAVTERTPVAVIDQGDGLRALDSEGVLFARYRTRPDGLPLVHTTAETSSEALVEAARVVEALPASISARVGTVEVASIDQIDLVLNSGRRVLWGNAQDSEQKAEVLAVLLGRPGQQIDVSVPSRPTTR